MAKMPPLAAEIITHHLRLFGVPAQWLAVDNAQQAKPKVRLMMSPSEADVDAVHAAVARGDVIVAVCPGTGFLANLEIGELTSMLEPESFVAPAISCLAGAHLRSLHSARAFVHPRGESIVCSAAGRTIWMKIQFGRANLLLIGSDLPSDLTRYRQGDPDKAADRPKGTMWGIAGERPNYLFDAQIPAGCEDERQADWWAMALAQTIASCIGSPLLALLPDGAPGALVVTGDDDQAFLEKYQEQLDLLNGLPITYFLHPLTRHRKETLRRLLRRPGVEFGLHPDALDDPTNYNFIFEQQADWYRQVTGSAARLVRNHGFLNDGYWGHLDVWLKRGVKASSNLPGLDGKILNGSLIPARMVWNGQLTNHWSVLTAIGDGVRFALNLDGPQSARCIEDLANRILRSKLPGVIVLNLHPQNVSETQHMHGVLHELVRGGFRPMKFSECIDWFAARDRTEFSNVNRGAESSLLRRATRFFGGWR